MLFEESLRSYLLDDTGVGAIAESRVYAVMAPRGAGVPRVVFAKAGELPTDMTACGPSGLNRVVYQFDSFGMQLKAALSLAKAIRTALIGFRGEMQGTRVSSVTLESEFHVPDPEPGLFRVSSTLLFVYNG